MVNSARDDNRVSTICGISSVDGVTPTRIQVNPVTNAIKVEGGGGGTPGGADTQVQFNDGGSFGGDSSFYFNKTTKQLTASAVNTTIQTAAQPNITSLGSLLSLLITPGDLGLTGTRVNKGWFTDLEVTNAIAGSITGNAATVSTITGLAPDTATTQATQAGITTCANLTTIGTVTTGTLSTGAVLADVTMTLGSDADGDIYYRSSNKLTRLAKGSAAEVLTMNAGATAPEWAAAGGGGLSWGDSISGSGETQPGITFTNVPDGTTYGAMSVTSASGNAVGLLYTADTGYVLRATPATYSYNANVGFVHIDLPDESTVNRQGRAIDIYTGENTGGGAGCRTGIRVQNEEDNYQNTTGAGAGISVYQENSGGTGISMRGSSNVNSSTNGLFHAFLDNTQSGASTLMKLDAGTSAQAHVGIEFDGSTSAKVMNVATNLTQSGGTSTGTTTKEIRILIAGTAYTIEAKSEA